MKTTVFAAYTGFVLNRLNQIKILRQMRVFTPILEKCRVPIIPQFTPKFGFFR